MSNSELPGKKYRQLVKQFPLFELRSEEDLDAAVSAIGVLYDIPFFDADEKTYFEALSVFIERYESRVHPRNFEKMTPLEALKSLLEDNHLIQADLARILHVTSGRASDIYLGKRDLSKEHIALLSDRFKVSANLFLPQPRRVLQTSVAESPALLDEYRAQDRKNVKTSTRSAAKIKAASKPVVTVVATKPKSKRK